MWSSLKTPASALSAIAVALVLQTSPSTGTAQTPLSKPLVTLPTQTKGTHYIVTRPDLRKCMYPMCGGYFVKAVNQLRTRCSDGWMRLECHAVDLDAAALGLDETQAAVLQDRYGKGQAVVQGQLRQRLHEGGQLVPTLVASAAWLGQGGGKPVGAFYGLRDNGIRCITYPCPSIAERKLNTSITRAIAGLDLTQSGATQAQIEAGQQALFTPGGLLAAGVHTVITGPAGDGVQLLASEFYLPAGTPAKP